MPLASSCARQMCIWKPQFEAVYVVYCQSDVSNRFHLCWESLIHAITRQGLSQALAHVSVNLSTAAHA